MPPKVVALVNQEEKIIHTLVSTLKT